MGHALVSLVFYDKNCPAKPCTRQHMSHLCICASSLRHKHAATSAPATDESKSISVRPCVINVLYPTITTEVKQWALPKAPDMSSTTSTRTFPGDLDMISRLYQLLTIYPSRN